MGKEFEFDYCMQIQALKEENEKLKAEISDVDCCNKSLIKENEKLKELLVDVQINQQVTQAENKLMAEARLKSYKEYEELIQQRDKLVELLKKVTDSVSGRYDFERKALQDAEALLKEMEEK